MNANSRQLARRREERRRLDEERRNAITKRRAAINRKRWCRGAEGVEHQPIGVNYKKFKQTSIGEHWFLLVCEDCKKVLAGYYPALIKHKPPPRRPARAEPVDDVQNA